MIQVLEAGVKRYETFGGFTHYFINQLFQQHGLVIIDQDNAALKRKFSEIILDEILQSRAAEVLSENLKFLDENYKVQFNCSPEVKSFSIEPLLLIPFVENAFKHISHKPGGSNYVKLDLSRSNGYFEFNVENSCEKGIQTTEQHGGIGMSNVKRRLELLYPDAHKLEVNEGADSFKINLKLKI